jgi:hypothetical protein
MMLVGIANCFRALKRYRESEVFLDFALQLEGTKEITNWPQLFQIARVKLGLLWETKNFVAAGRLSKSLIAELESRYGSYNPAWKSDYVDYASTQIALRKQREFNQTMAALRAKFGGLEYQEIKRNQIDKILADFKHLPWG